MNEVIIVLAVVVVIGLVITRQLKGEALRGKRVILLPAILLVVGAVGLNGTANFKPIDGILIGVSGLVAAAVGSAMGAAMHLEDRDGGLWGRLPRRGLWLWGALIASRVAVEVVAAAVGAKATSSENSILLVLGINRLAQAAVIVARAVRADIPFAPEKDGKPFMPGLFPQATSSQARRTPPAPPATPAGWTRPAPQARQNARARQNTRAGQNAQDPQARHAPPAGWTTPPPPDPTAVWQSPLAQSIARKVTERFGPTR
jgi:hypothetical protein